METGSSQDIVVQALRLVRTLKETEQDYEMGDEVIAAQSNLRSFLIPLLKESKEPSHDALLEQFLMLFANEYDQRLYEVHHEKFGLHFLSNLEIDLERLQARHAGVEKREAA